MSFLCQRCAKGQLEICQYFLENFVEDYTAITKCPEFEEDAEEPIYIGEFEEDEDGRTEV